MVLNEMSRWLASYEESRHKRLESELWQSSKYDFGSMDWRELQRLSIEGLYDSENEVMNFGQAVSSLKKLWWQYKFAHKEGTVASVLNLSLTHVLHILMLTTSS